MRKREELALIKKEFNELRTKELVTRKLLDKIKCFENINDFSDYLSALHNSFDIQLNCAYEKISNE